LFFEGKQYESIFNLTFGLKIVLVNQF
jgi:hypothetical protein